MKKLFFSDKFSLTQAVLDGTKTMTRRILHGTLFWERCPEGMWTDDEIKAWRKEVDQRLIDYSTTDEWPQMVDFAMKHCRYQVGEVVAIAQPYKEIVHDSAELNDILTDNDGRPRDEYKVGWNNKMFTRADLLIHHIRITNVRMERLQDISEDDIMHEGIEYANGGYYVNYNKETHSRTWLGNTLHDAYSTLIDKISGNGTWLRNPWVMVYEFEKVD